MEESSPVQSETDLAIRLMSGEDEAFRELVRVHGPKVKGYLAAKFSPNTADEAFVDAIGKVWANAMSYDESKGALGPWFLSIAHRCALDIVGLRRRRDNDKLPDDYPPEAEEEEIPKKERERRQRYVKAVREIMLEMSEQQRAIIQADLAYLSGDVPHDVVAPVEELAQALNKTKNNIYKIRHDARAKLRREMERRGFYSEG